MLTASTVTGNAVPDGPGFVEGASSYDFAGVSVLDDTAHGHQRLRHGQWRQRVNLNTHHAAACTGWATSRHHRRRHLAALALNTVRRETEQPGRRRGRPGHRPAVGQRLPPTRASCCASTRPAARCCRRSTLSAAVFGVQPPVQLRGPAGAGHGHDAGHHRRARGQLAGLQRPHQPRPRGGDRPRRRQRHRQPVPGRQLRPHRWRVRPGQRRTCSSGRQPQPGQPRSVEIDPATAASCASISAADQRAELGRAGHRPGQRQPVAGLEQRRRAGVPSSAPTRHRAVRRIDLAAQGIDQGEISGLAFAPDGSLWVVLHPGRGLPARSAVDAGGRAHGHADAGRWPAPPTARRPMRRGRGQRRPGDRAGRHPLRCRHAGAVRHPRQRGQHRRRLGQTRWSSTTPARGCRCWCPTWPPRGDVRVVNRGATNLGFGSPDDAVYRNVSLGLHGRRSTATVRFADGGLQACPTRAGASTTFVVTPGRHAGLRRRLRMRRGHRARWSDGTVNADDLATFSRFSGRFSNNASQMLEPERLDAPGRPTTLSFDL